MRFCILLFILGVPIALHAGEVFGSVREGNQPVANVPVEIQCGTEKLPAARTDQYGAYSIYVPKPGACTLRVFYNNQAPEIEIQSYASPQRYDVLLVLEGNKYVLRRT